MKTRRLVDMEGESVAPTTLGRISSFYYLKYPTMATFASGAEDVTSHQEVFKMMRMLMFDGITRLGMLL